MSEAAPHPDEPLRILYLEDAPEDAELAIRELKHAGIVLEWVRVDTEVGFREALGSFRPDLVLADFSIPGWSGLAALQLVRVERPDLPYIVVTGTLDEETAAACIKAGADDYILKERRTRLPHAVVAARKAWETRVAQRKAEAELRLRNSALEAAANGVVITDTDGKIVWTNPAFTEMTGYSLEEVVGQTPRILKSGVQREAFYRQLWGTIKAGEVWRGELYNRRKDGSLYIEEMAITPVKGEKGAMTHFVAIMQDVSARKRQEAEIQSLATRDLLTGLPNQSVLREDVQSLVETGADGTPSSLLMIDVDRFSLVNDALGHPAGDRLLGELAERLAEVLSPRASLYRFGGDEFVALLRDTSLENASALAEEVREKAGTVRLEGEGMVFDVTVSIGVAPIDPSSPGSASLALADAALQEAKEKGRNRVVAYRNQPSGPFRMDELSRWAARVKDALKTGGFRLLAQKIVSLSTEKSDHKELLVRMVDDNGGLIPPGSFLPAAEKFGLMPALDRWVTGSAIEALSAGLCPRLFVNLSGASLGDVALLSQIEALVGKSGLAPGALTFEITETAAIADLAGVQRWAGRLHELGCGFALDDFGTGFSSFAYLQALPVDLVKIDGSFVRDLDTNPTNRALVKAMVDVAHALGKTVVAEMVERRAVATILAELGAEYGQGWLWGRPEPLDAI